MPGNVRSSTASPPRRKRKNRKALLTVVGIAGCALVIGGGVLAWKNENTILRILHRGPINPPRAAPVPAFSAYKTLNDFKDVECIYTAKFVEPLPGVNEPTPVNLMPLSRLVVQKILRLSGDFDHPTSSGFKVYAMSRNATALPKLGDPNSMPVKLLDTQVVLYPVVGNNDEVIELHLCPVTAFKKAQNLWLDRSFKYAGSQLSGAEIDPGTIVTVTDVAPGYFGTFGVTFDLTLRLPSGQTTQLSINPDNMGLLQPSDQ
jgi:hypothetical protein